MHRAFLYDRIMIDRILTGMAGVILATITHLGYTGIVLLMAVESACIPLPSEIILPFSGYLVYQGTLNLWGVGIAGAVGCVLGSLVAYYAGARGGRPALERYGRYLLISRHDLELADRWFQRHGDITIFVARLLPVVRTFIALPAGVARMNLPRFIAYTFAGSLLWSLGLAWIGLKLGEHWDTLGGYFHRFDALIAGTLLLAAAWYVRRHLRSSRE
ncbi:inner membrane protein YabI [bacterium BMS3Bbin12]|nr:inner membrane protein YabI [bacterium BMS3Abin12]GBE47859.1 inner membrane protein YabI [bacterium BMS3Bbin12]GBE50157.1 inner membrane protein YabI [bacterium BMS3Bbin13]